MELQVLVAHGSNRAFALEEPLEVGPNVRPSVPVAIQWNLAASLCATPQPPNPPPSFMLNLFPRFVRLTIRHTRANLLDSFSQRRPLTQGMRHPRTTRPATTTDMRHITRVPQSSFCSLIAIFSSWERQLLKSARLYLAVRDQFGRNRRRTIGNLAHPADASGRGLLKTVC